MLTITTNNLCDREPKRMRAVPYVVDCKIDKSQVVIVRESISFGCQVKVQVYSKMESKSFLMYLLFGSHPNNMGLVGKTVFHVYTLSHISIKKIVIMSLCHWKAVFIMSLGFLVKSVIWVEYISKSSCNHNSFVRFCSWMLWLDYMPMKATLKLFI